MGDASQETTIKNKNQNRMKTEKRLLILDVNQSVSHKLMDSKKAGGGAERDQDGLRGAGGFECLCVLCSPRAEDQD